MGRGDAHPFAPSRLKGADRRGPGEFANGILKVLAGAGDGVLPHGRPEAVTPQDPRTLGAVRPRSAS